MSNMSREGNCVVCQRINPAEVFKQGHTLLDRITDKETIRKINLDAIQCINYADKQHRVFFCGLRASTLLAGLFYLLCPRYGFKITLETICDFTELTSVTICRSYHKWAQTFPELFPEWEKTRKTTKRYVHWFSDRNEYDYISEDCLSWRLRPSSVQKVKEIARRDVK